MKLQNKLFSIQTFIIFATANLVLVSCGTYQTAYYEDGIYSSPEKIEKRQIVVVEKNNNDNFEENYFTKKLDSLERISEYEIFTDIDSYSSNPNYTDPNGNYNQNSPWGYQNDNVVVNVNLINDPFWYGNGFGMWGWNDWGWNNWGWNNWGWNRWNVGWGWNRWNNWGFYGNPYWHPYAYNWGWNGGFYNPYFYGNPWRNNGYYRNNTYGRRNTNYAYGRRDSNGIIRNNSITNRRNYYDYNQNSNNVRRSSISTPVRRSSTIRGNDSNDRNSNYSSRNSSNTNNNTNSTSRRSTTTSSRSSGNTTNSSRGSTTSRGRRGN
ncbi:hypothetical protein [Polaribacter sp.]|uniref:hypothetical protein n=1 Tax=Polaribacter sp. TaxID=1920175 RepID=UPI004047449F